MIGVHLQLRVVSRSGVVFRYAVLRDDVSTVALIQVVTFHCEVLVSKVNITSYIKFALRFATFQHRWSWETLRDGFNGSGRKWN